MKPLTEVASQGGKTMSVSTTSDPVTGSETSPPDESWWSSLLENEEEYQQVTPVDEEGYTSLLIAKSLPDIDWDLVQTIYERDDIISLEVRSYNRGGLLVGTGAVQGFVPISHLIDLPVLKSNQERKKRLPGYIGCKLELKIIECDPEEARVVLSERAALAGEGSRNAIFQSIKPGQMVTGTVTNITKFGAFVDLGGVEGLIHISELSWGRVEHPRNHVEIGQTIEARVLKINESNGRVALSHKQLLENPWEQIARLRKIGDILPAEITNIQPYGIFARLDEGIEGLIHITNIDLPPDCEEPEDIYTVGNRINVSILQIDPDRRRLGLKVVD